MKKPKNVYIRDLMDSRQHNVLKLPCGWLIIHLQTRKFGSYVDLRSQNGQPMLHERCEFYEAELINDDARRWNGYVMGATIDNSFIPYLVDPENIFLSKDWMIAWDQQGRCFHWGPAPFVDIDRKAEEKWKKELKRRKAQEA